MDWQRVLDQVVSLVSSVVALLTLAAPVWVPLLTSRIKDKRRAAAVEAVSQAGLMAINGAAAEYRRRIVLAKAPDSPGGVLVTPEESKAALGVGVGAGFSYLRNNGLWDRVVAIYGGEDELRHALEAIMCNTLHGSETTATPPQPPMLLSGAAITTVTNGVVP